MSTAAKLHAPGALSMKSRIVVLTAVFLGFAQLLSLGFHWHSPDSRRFLLYLIVAGVASFFHLNRTDHPGGFSLNLPIVLLSIVELTMPEAVIIGCLAAMIQSLRSADGWSFRRLGVTLGVQATVVSSASFALATASLHDVRLNDPPIRLFLAAVALFVANTFPATILRRSVASEGEPAVGKFRGRLLLFLRLYLAIWWKCSGGSGAAPGQIRNLVGNTVAGFDRVIPHLSPLPRKKRNGASREKHAG